jgi:PKHD-type hydroxylase
MVVEIKKLLKGFELESILKYLLEAKFQDGKSSASGGAKDIKNNLQLDIAGDQKAGLLLSQIMQAILSNLQVQSVAMPKFILPPLISKYGPGMKYGMHTDSPLMGQQQTIRTDLAMTIFLSDPEAYEGGELILLSPFGEIKYKLAKGDAVLYPTNYLHRVGEVTSGERIVAVTWVQSIIKDHSQREILYNLKKAYEMMTVKEPNSEELNLLRQAYAMILRMWTEI